MAKGFRKPRTAAQKAAAIRNIKKAQTARDKAIISEAEKNLALGKKANSLSGLQKGILTGVGAVGVAATVLGGPRAAAGQAVTTAATYRAMKAYNNRRLQEAGQRTGNKTYNLSGTNPNRLTSKQLAWSFGVGGFAGMGVARGYNALTGRKK